MRYFTKEWYELMQQQIGVEGLTKVADKVYSDAEIQAFYERDLKKEIAHDRKLYNMKPTFEWKRNCCVRKTSNRRISCLWMK